MYRYIHFSKDGVKDISPLKESINILDIKDNSNAAILAALLDNDFFPRVGFRNGSPFREVYTGNRIQELKLKPGNVITLKSDEISEIDTETFDLNPEIFNDFKVKPVSILKKDGSHELENAKLVFLAGRGVGNRKTYEKLKELALKYNAKMGCTRPVSMNGWESYDNFVGISGKSLNADICVAFGVSGSGPLIKGLENVKKIIAINNDKDALIFSYADLCIVEDLNKVLMEL